MSVPIEIVVAVVGAFFSILGFGFLIIWQNTKAINSIHITISEINMKENFEGKACDNRHATIEKRLNEHSSKIEAHGLVIAEHEVKLKEILS